MAEPFTTLAFLAGRHQPHPPRHRRLPRPPAQPALHRQGGRQRRLAVGRPLRLRHRRGLAAGGVRGARRPVGAPGRRNDEYIELMQRLWCDAESSFEGEFWTLAAVAGRSPSRCSSPIRPSTSAARATSRCAGSSASARDWLPFNVSPGAAGPASGRLAGAARGHRRGRSTTCTSPPAPDRRLGPRRAGRRPSPRPAPTSCWSTCGARSPSTTSSAALDELAAAYGVAG